jgi:hypothetical protein
MLSRYNGSIINISLKGMTTMLVRECQTVQYHYVHVVKNAKQNIKVPLHEALFVNTIVKIHDFLGIPEPCRKTNLV